MDEIEAIAADLRICARKSILVMPKTAPGRTWFDILRDAPRNARGHTMAFSHTLRPLLRRGLLHREEQRHRVDGTRPFDRFWLTPRGRLVCAVLLAHPKIGGEAGGG